MTDSEEIRNLLLQIRNKLSGIGDELENISTMTAVLDDMLSELSDIWDELKSISAMTNVLDDILEELKEERDQDGQEVEEELEKITLTRRIP